MTRHLIRFFCAMLLVVTALPSKALADSKVIELDFNDTDVSTMVKYISCLTGKKLVLGDQVTGKVSLCSDSKLSIDETYKIIITVLELKGFSVVQNENGDKIILTAEALSDFNIPVSKSVPVNKNYIAQSIKLKNITAREALSFLKPMVSKDGAISAFDVGNLILLMDSSLNISIIKTVLKAIDTELPDKGSDVIYLKNASAESVAETIRQWLSDSGTAGSVLENRRQNALLLFGDATIKKTINEIVTKLDVTPRIPLNKPGVPDLEIVADADSPVETPATASPKLLLLGTATGTPQETFALVQHMATQQERVFQLGDMVFDTGCLLEVKKDQAIIVLKGQTRLKLDIVRETLPTALNHETR